MIKGICFDLDGTLGRYAGDFQAFAALLRSQLMLQMCDMNRFYGLLETELRRDGHVTLERALAGVLEGLQQREPADLAQLAAEAARAYAEEVRPLPGARELLARLDAAGVKLALLSNGPEDMQKAALAALGFERYFRVVLVSGDRDVAARKPAPRIFSLACAGLQTVPEETLMVGDSLEADIAGALDYGLQAVLVRRPRAVGEAVGQEDAEEGAEGSAGTAAGSAAGSAPVAVPPGVQVVAGLAELEDLLRVRYGL